MPEQETLPGPEPARTPSFHRQAASTSAFTPTQPMDSTEILEELDKFPLLRKWSPGDKQYLAAQIAVQNFSTDEIIFDAGGDADNAYLIHQGRVAQSLLNRDGTKWTFRTLQETGIFAQQVIFRGQNHASEAKALADCVLFEIPAAVLSWALSRYPDLWKALLRPDLAGRLRSIPLFRSMSDPQIQRLADSAEAREVPANQPICQAGADPGSLYIIDWGQVEVTEQLQLTMTGGNPQAEFDPDPDIAEGQLLTAGNWFIGGLVKIPKAPTFSAAARTRVRLIVIPGLMLESIEDHFADISAQIGHRFDLLGVLRHNLSGDSLFAGLSGEHWLELASFTNWEYVPAGIAVSRQGERDRRLFLLVAGTAVVRATDEAGRERPRYYLEVGRHSGIDPLQTGERRVVTVRAQSRTVGGVKEDGADWLVLSYEDLELMMKLKPKLWRDTELRRSLVEAPRQKKYDWLEDEEQEVDFGRRHILALLAELALPFGIAAVVTAILTVIQSFSSFELPLTTYTFGLVVFLLIMLPIPFIDYFDDYYIITNRRVVVHERWLIFSETRKEAPLERLQNITLRTALLATIFGYGDLDISTAATAGTIRFRMVPDPHRVQGIIFAQQRQVQAGRQAGRREAMRQQMLSRLEMRESSDRRQSVLPSSYTLPQKGFFPWLSTKIQGFFQTIGNVFAALRRFILTVLLFWVPKDRREQIIKRKKMKRSRTTLGDEDVVYLKHLIFLIMRAFLPFVAFLVSGFVFVAMETGRFLHFFPFTLPGWVQFVALGLWIVTFIILWYQVEDYRNDKYVLTKNGIIDIEALPFGLAEQARQANWDRVQNASYDIPNLVARIFNYGTVVIETAAAEGQFDFIRVPRPRAVQREIFRRLERYRLEKEQQDAVRSQAALSETLKIYDELRREAAEW